MLKLRKHYIFLTMEITIEQGMALINRRNNLLDKKIEEVRTIVISALEDNYRSLNQVTRQLIQDPNYKQVFSLEQQVNYEVYKRGLLTATREQLVEFYYELELLRIKRENFARDELTKRETK